MKITYLFVKPVTRLLSIVTLVSVILSSGEAFALALSEGQAYLDWSTLQISGGGGLAGVSWNNGVGTGISWSNRYSTYQAGYTTPNNGSDLSPVFSPNHWDPASRRRDNPSGTAAGYSYSVADGKFYGSYKAQADGSSFGDSVIDPYSASAMTGRGGRFTVSDVNAGDGNAGTLTFIIQYRIYQRLFVENSLTDTADISTRVNLSLDGVEQDSMWMYNDYTSGTDGVEQEFLVTNSLMFTMAFSDGGSGVLEGYVTNSGWVASDGSILPPEPLDPPVGPDPVPEPSTFILLGAGLMGVMFIRRKKQKDARTTDPL